MTENQESNAGDFAATSFEIAPGLFIPDKIPFNVRLQIEQETGKDWQDINWGSAVNISMLVTKLAKYLDPQLTDLDIGAALADADMTLVTAALDQAFVVNLKNFRRQDKKTIAGNLKE